MSGLNGYRPVPIERLAPLEAVIERGLSTFLEVGRALQEIRDLRLYYEYGTFENYCRDRWGFTPQHGGRLIAAAEVAAIVEPIGSTPASESVARELAPTLHRDGAEATAEIWQRTTAEHGPQPTAAQVRETARGSSVKRNRSERIRDLADEQRRWTGKLSKFITGELGDDPLPEDVRRQLAVGAVQRAHAAASVLDALAEGEPPDLDVLDAAPKFADESRRDG